MSETLSPILPAEVDRAVRHTLERMIAAGLRLATAESCTGGMLASLFTDVEGASHGFDRGFVVYTDAAKSDLLGILPERIKAHGAVSAEVACDMAEGALAQSAADIAIATTGFAGAAGPHDETGLVHFACARKGCTTKHRVEHFGDIGRGPIRIESMRVAIEMLSEAL